MLATPFYNGQGIGNQLHNYVAVKTLALDKGYDFGVINPQNFKGKSFMSLDMGKSIEMDMGTEGIRPPNGAEWYKETTSDYDPKLKDIEDGTIVHGNLQGELYIEHRRDEIKQWLKVEPVEVNKCIINFRGGEYQYVADFFLPKSYWEKAISIMKNIKPDMEFEVHTDDPVLAARFFPGYNIVSDIEINWRTIRYAEYLIISNSSFAWLPAWLGDAKLILAPEFWGRRNKGYWFLEQNKTKRFLYI